MSEPATVYFVHAIDTEGPLFESVDARFERLEELYSVSGLPRTQKTLRELQSGALPLGGKEKEIQELLNGHRINYMDDWSKLDAMLDRTMSDDFRNKCTDSFGGGWVYNWYCLDHVDFTTNPRRRTLGYHAIHDHYIERTREPASQRDEIHWHFHPMSTYKEAHRCATSYINSPHLYETLARRIIERGYFPSSYRAGFQTERPDSHWFLEQWIPFDISNTAIDSKNAQATTTDLRNGRSGDWRRAPTDWTPYHPHHDDYQQQGDCRRWIARALNVLNRFANIDDLEINKAFAQAKEGKPTIVGIASHDYRDLTDEVEFVRNQIAKVAAQFPNVKYKFAGAAEAFRAALELPVTDDKIELSIDLQRNPADDVPHLTVRCVNGRVFGPQPFLAIETQGKRFIHDNLDFDLGEGVWHYAFHSDTLPLTDVKTVGVGANDANGFTSVVTIAV